ncbi:MAG TPA: hypothetical protein VF268_02045 [Gammaproteobacteria bacterium]
MEQVLKSYKSVTVLFGYLANDFAGFYRRVAQEYELLPLILFLIQLTALVIAGNVLLIPAGDDTGEFSKVWFVFGYIQQAVVILLFASFFYAFMRLSASGFKENFSHILKFFLVLFILFQSIVMIFSFLSDLYLYAGTDYFEPEMSFPDSVIEARIFYFIESYVLGAGFALLLASLLYVSVYRSKITLLCLGLFSVLYVFVVHPCMSDMWDTYLCRRLEVCFMPVDIGDAAFMMNLPAE